MQRIRMLLVVVTMLVLLAACGAANTATSPRQNVITQPAIPTPAAAGAPAGESEQKANDGVSAPPTDKSTNQNITFVSDPNRKIIKNGDMQLEVENASIGISRVTAIAAQLGGYVTEVKSEGVSGQAGSATVGIAVPVDQFETAMQRVRESGKKVLSEQATGQDVSQEFVDTQSQIANLEATQARVRGFLEDAKTVEEALNVNKQLTELEGQISQLKGRLQFLTQRAAFSTITVGMREIPLVATPTPILPPTWSASKTVEAATATLQSILQGIATVAIWLGIVVLPILIPAGVLWLLVRQVRSRGRRPAPPTRTE